MTTRTRRAAIGTTAAAIALAGLAVALPADAEPGSGIDWQPCPETTEIDCATLEVPIDWSDPDAGSTEIALARRPATDPDERIGSILMDPGGPGGSGVDLVTAENLFTPAVSARFDTIGFDPRGVGASDPITCDPDLFAKGSALVMPTSAAEYDEMVATNGEIADDCRDRTGPLYDHVDTGTVVRDIEAIRIALDEGKLNYVGYSYGTLMGQQYAERYPHHIRAMVMDGNMDHSQSSTWEQMRSQVAAAEDIFVDFADWCDTDTDCALNGMDVREVYGELREQAREGTLTDPGSGAAIGFGDFAGLVPGAARPSRWPGLAEDLKALYTRAGSFSAAADSAEPVAFPNQAIWCQDWALPVDGYDEWKSYLDRLASAYPNTQWTTNLNTSLMCQGYPGETTNPQHELDIDGAPPLVMLGNLHDPATVYDWSRAAAEQSGARLVTYEGYGHTIYAYGRPSDCVNDAVDDYLINLDAPPDGLHCANAETPGTEPGIAGTDLPGPGYRS